MRCPYVHVQYVFEAMSRFLNFVMVATKTTQAYTAQTRKIDRKLLVHIIYPRVHLNLGLNVKYRQF